VALVLGALVVPTPASAAIFRVGSTADAIDATPGDGHCAAAPPASGACTLRAAIEEANSNTDPDAVVLPRGHYVLSVAGDNEDAAASGDLDLTTPVTIGGANARTTIVDAHGIDRGHGHRRHRREWGRRRHRGLGHAASRRRFDLRQLRRF
jgi:CSLREA domain-containing protein